MSGEHMSTCSLVTQNITQLSLTADTLLIGL